MTKFNYGLIDCSYIVYIFITSFIIPMIYLCFLNLSSVSNESLNSLLSESERLSIHGYINHDLIGSYIEFINSDITLHSSTATIDYFIQNNDLKRRIKRTQKLNQFLQFSQLELISKSCFSLNYQNNQSLQLCAIDY